MDLTTDIQPLSYFKRNTPAAIRQIKKGRPMVLTIDGKAQLVVLDTKEYQAYARHKEHEEMLAFLEESRQDIAKGRVRPMRQALAEIAEKYDLPSRRRPKGK